MSFCCSCLLSRAHVLHSRVDITLADGVYELVAEQEEDHQQPLTQFELEQDPNQSSEEPKAAEGKHQSMSPYLKNSYATTYLFTCAFKFEVLFETLVACFP